MLQHVYERTSRASRLSGVLVATDDRRIFDLVTGFGGRVVMTSFDHVCGTDRVAEVAAGPEGAGMEIVVNVQGDQPLIEPDALDRLVAVFDDDAELRMATLFEPLTDEAGLVDPNVAKVVSDGQGNALYFSRAPIPYRPRGAGPAGCFKHVGVYAFRKDFLFEFTHMERGRLEAIENLEQLRALEAGHRIRLVASTGHSISVETPGDLERIQALIQ
jgi:3-deoxy-manno-octulosonate cytidylyltransferase (CMP-KDO synthetase)